MSAPEAGSDDLPDGDETPDFAPGTLVYLQIPATNVAASAAFYRAAFGWDADAESAGFVAPGLFGQFVTDRAPGGESGMLGWIHVASMPDAIAAVRANGGEMIDEPYPDGPVRWLAEARDPAGNAVGLVTHGPVT